MVLEKLGKTSGAGATKILEELTLCGFVEEVRPISFTEKRNIMRYRILDYFLHFYFMFIAPQREQILEGQFAKNPVKALPYDRYRSWLGLAFERFCRQSQVQIAEILGFSGVEYSAGSMYHRRSLALGYQIDLAFKRRDKVFTICECKYSDSPIGIGVINDVEKKIEALGLDKRNWIIQRVLISASGISEELSTRGYFDRVIGLEDLGGGF